MKNFFEIIGFVATAILSGFLIFSYIGHVKGMPKKETIRNIEINEAGIESEITSFSDQPQKRKQRNQEDGELSAMPSLPSIAAKNGTSSSDKRKKPAETPAIEYDDEPAHNSIKGNTAGEYPERVKDLFEDESYVKKTLKIWKKKVAQTANDRDLRPDLLMANILLKGYFEAYTEKDFSKDASSHAGDTRKVEEVAIRHYDNPKDVSRLIKIFDLDELFFTEPTFVAAHQVTPAKTLKSAPKEKSSIAIKTKPSKSKVSKNGIEDEEDEMPVKLVSSVPNRTQAFREMVAKQYGFSTWQGLQTLGDIDIKKKAEQRVQILASSARVK